MLPPVPISSLRGRISTIHIGPLLVAPRDTGGQVLALSSPLLVPGCTPSWEILGGMPLSPTPLLPGPVPCPSAELETFAHPCRTQPGLCRCSVGNLCTTHRGGIKLSTLAVLFQHWRLRPLSMSTRGFLCIALVPSTICGPV